MFETNEVLPEPSGGMYDLEFRRTAKGIPWNTILTSRPIASVSCSSFFLVGLRTNRKISTDLENPDYLEGYSENLYDLGEF